jgi:hypothetical protein
MPLLDSAGLPISTEQVIACHAAGSLGGDIPDRRDCLLQEKTHCRTRVEKRNGDYLLLVFACFGSN